MAVRKTPGSKVAEAAASGDYRTTLEAIRDQLAHQLERAEPAVAAQIAGQLRQTLKDLAQLPPAKGGSKLDEVRARREARRGAGAAPASDAGRGGRKRGG